MDPLSLLVVLTAAGAVATQLRDENRLRSAYADAWGKLIAGLPRPSPGAAPQVVEAYEKKLVAYDKAMELGEKPPMMFWGRDGALHPLPDPTDKPRRREPWNVQVFFVPEDEIVLDDGTWMSERLAERLRDEISPRRVHDVMQAIASQGVDEALEEGDITEEEAQDYRDAVAEGVGWYYWTQIGACLPDSEANGPFETVDDAVFEAWESDDFEDLPPGTKIETWEEGGGFTGELEPLGAKMFEAALAHQRAQDPMQDSRELEARAHRSLEGSWIVFSTPYGQVPVGPYDFDLQAYWAVRDAMGLR